MIDRRALIGTMALGAVLAASRLAPAQPARRVHRIGNLGLATSADLSGAQPRSASAAALIQGMRELGYEYGEHFVTEARGAEGRPERFGGLVAELIRLQVDVIVAAGPALPALKQAASTIPVVMAASSDPIGEGLVRSLGRPGGNFTGLSLQSIETSGKRLELIKELAPAASTVAMVWSQTNLPVLQAMEAAARERGWKLQPLKIREVADLPGALKAATDARAGALLVFAAGALFPHARRVVDQVARTRLPALYELRPYAEAGGLMSYGADILDIWRRSAAFVDRILKGTRPADLPVEQPSKFELVINVKVAQALGLTIPPRVLLRADEILP